MVHKNFYMPLMPEVDMEIRIFVYGNVAREQKKVLTSRGSETYILKFIFSDERFCSD